MSLKRRLRTMACCGMLEIGALFGMPMRPEQVQEFMAALSEQKVAHTLPSEDESGDPPDPPLDEEGDEMVSFSVFASEEDSG